jgi:Adenylate cyclase, family 3 (some proteins contain HAMP domain)
VIGEIRAHLDRGAPWDACDAFREAIAERPDDDELLYWGALAHARAGAARTAHALLDEAEERPGLARERLADILSLRGRLYKDAFDRAPRRAESAVLAARARDQYVAAYAIAQDPYPGINAATLSMLLGDRPAALQLAREIAARLLPRVASDATWDLATAAEAQLLLGHFDDAARLYADAYQSAQDNSGVVATMRRQLRLLALAIPHARELLERVPAVNVVAFAGHIVDRPDRPTARFPRSLVPVVEAAIRERLAALRRPVVFASAACGGDLLFIEAAQSLAAEVNIVLPFERDEFVRTSVAVGGDEWLPRFESALQRAARVIMATDEAYLGDDVLFEHAAVLVEGLAMLRADQLQATPSLLCVIDPEDAGRTGGTRSTMERWKNNVGTPDIIDLCELRARAPSAIAGARSLATAPMRESSGPATPAEPVPRQQRALKTMLFADIAGYSRMRDASLLMFQQRFLDLAAALIADSPVPPLEAKTWGDALYAVFEAPRDGGAFALTLLERMQGVDWKGAGLSDAGRIRIALHAGPVFCGFDPVMERDSHFGTSVTRTARIEPVTPPGMIYTSEAFAAALASTGQREYTLEYIGSLALAKGYGESRIYRLDSR